MKVSKWIYLKRGEKMKEVLYEDWQKNPTPRMMWVWDDNPANAVKRKVVYFSGEELEYPVIIVTFGEAAELRFKHCAEIEEQRRMTNKELARWLRGKPTREWKITVASTVHTVYSYDEECADKECWSEIVVRENGGEWREPLMEVEE